MSFRNPVTPESIGAIPEADRGVAGGVATLDSQILLTQTQARSSSGIRADRPAFGQVNRYYYASDEEKLYLDDGTQWLDIPISHFLKYLAVDQIAYDDSVAELTIFDTDLPDQAPQVFHQLYRLSMFGTYLNDTAVTRTLRCRLKWDAVTYFDKTMSFPSSAIERDWRLESLLHLTGDDTAQAIFTEWKFGQGDILEDQATVGSFATAAPGTLEATIQHSFASVDAAVVMKSALLERIQ